MRVRRRRAGMPQRKPAVNSWLILGMLVVGFTALLVTVILSMALVLELTGTTLASGQTVSGPREPGVQRGVQ